MIRREIWQIDIEPFNKTSPIPLALLIGECDFVQVLENQVVGCIRHRADFLNDDASWAVPRHHLGDKVLAELTAHGLKVGHSAVRLVVELHSQVQAQHRRPDQ